MLLSLFNRKKPVKQFLSLVISEGTVAAALWNVGDGEPKVLKTSAPVPWNNEAESSLIEASDVALENLGSEANTTKEVLLGLPEHWAAHQSIATDKKHLLKNLTDQLNLKSVGFVITQEAIAALFRDQEQAGCNALLVYVSLQKVYVLTILHGKASECVSVGRSESLVNDVIEGCARGKFTGLPARILLASQDADETELKTLEAQVMANAWSEELFMRPPRVDLVPGKTILEAVSLAGGKEVAKALGILVPKANDTESVPIKTESGSEVAKEEESTPFGFAPVADGAATSEDANDSPSDDEDESVDSEQQLDLGTQDTLAPRFKVGKILAVVVGILVVIVGGLALGYLGLKSVAVAKLAVVISTEPVSFDTTMTIDANAAATDPANSILKASLRTKDVTDSSQAVTTGSKIIGDKAAGSVTIYNRTTVGDKTFKAGTVLVLDSKISYTLDSDTTVPVGTKDSGYVGKISAKVTAVNIGAESNIAQATELSVGGFDKASFVATTDAALTGGASRTIQVVSDSDQKQLADKLFASLKVKALAAFTQEADPTEHVILSDKVVVSKQQFSDDIGKEVKSFTLTMTVSATAIVYTNSDVAAFATAKLASQIPAGAVLKSDQTVVVVNNSQTVSDTKTLVSAKISSVIVPAFDPKQIAAVLAGKPLVTATAFLQNQHAINSYTLNFSPTFAKAILGAMPVQSEKIQITTTVR